jgi:hypothetical protein
MDLFSSTEYNPRAGRFFDNLDAARVFRVGLSVFARNREVRERCGHCSNREVPLSAFGTLQLLFALVRRTGAAHRRWDPRQGFLVRAARFAHRKVLCSADRFYREGARSAKVGNRVGEVERPNRRGGAWDLPTTATSRHFPVPSGVGPRQAVLARSDESRCRCLC